MKAHVLRIHPGNDLKKEVINFCHDQTIAAGCVISAVGSLKKLNLRLAKSSNFLTHAKYYEILSLNGTVSNSGLHLHLSVADENGNSFGGHLADENIIFTTCELIILQFNEFSFSRMTDEETTFKELIITKT